MLTLVLAAFGVFAGRGLKEQAAFLVLASVATLLIGVGLNTTEALSASLYYLIHSTLIGAALFLLADLIARGRGSYSDRLRVAPAMENALLLGSIFIVSAIAITGMPPLSGFFGKVLILDAALGHDWQVWVFSTVLTGSLLMMIAMARAGSTLFYQVSTDTHNDGSALNPSALVVVISLLLLSPALVITAGPVTELTQQVAEQFSHSQGYIDAVLKQTAVTGE
jgi:multicomponent K+:H+ antiporter subunit D